jgi:hypothetical protein
MVLMDLAALGDVERRPISPQQASRVKIDAVAQAAAVSPDAVGAAARALLG